MKDMEELHAFIVEAKAAAYVGGRAAGPSSRRGSHDIAHQRGAWSYLDSYYGGTNFIGQEVVWLDGNPTWAMNYYGRILDPSAIDGSRAGTVIRTALPLMYAEGRFLGGFDHEVGTYRYLDESKGDHRSFTGIERILADGREVYRLDYHGGLIVD